MGNRSYIHDRGGGIGLRIPGYIASVGLYPSPHPLFINNLRVMTSKMLSSHCFYGGVSFQIDKVHTWLTLSMHTQP